MPGTTLLVSIHSQERYQWLYFVYPGTFAGKEQFGQSFKKEKGRKEEREREREREEREREEREVGEREGEKGKRRRHTYDADSVERPQRVFVFVSYQH